MKTKITLSVAGAADCNTAGVTDTTTTIQAVVLGDAPRENADAEIQRKSFAKNDAEAAVQMMGETAQTITNIYGLGPSCMCGCGCGGATHPRSVRVQMALCECGSRLVDCAEHFGLWVYTLRLEGLIDGYEAAEDVVHYETFDAPGARNGRGYDETMLLALSRRLKSAITKERERQRTDVRGDYGLFSCGGFDNYDMHYIRHYTTAGFTADDSSEAMPDQQRPDDEEVTL